LSFLLELLFTTLFFITLLFTTLLFAQKDYRISTMGFSIWQLLIVLVIVLIFFGPQRLEGLGSSLGKAIRGFKKGVEEDVEEDKDAKALSDKSSADDIEINKVEKSKKSADKKSH
jgi:sec-independent protein translocase protein TatA